MKTLKKITLLSCLIIFSVSLFYSCKKKEVSPTSPNNSTINFTPAKTSSELIALRANKNNNIIRSLSDFDKLVSSKQSPLSKLSSEAINEFRDQLVVRENVGVVGLKYGIIKSSLTDDEFATVMASFGLDTKDGFWGFSKNKNVINKTKINQPVTEGFPVVDYPDYECSSAHNCHKNSAYICLTGC